MITETIINIFLVPIFMAVELVPDVILNATIPVQFVSGMRLLLGNLFYVLPAKEIIQIYTTKMFLKNARNVWALVIRVKSFIPTMGS